MKTAIIRTSFWKEDKIFDLNSDTRLVYLCILTNPDRDTTPAFKCSDRMLSAYTGYTKELLKICKNQLVKAGLIEIVDEYIIINNQDYVEPKKGKLTQVLFDKNYSNLPLNVKERVDNLLKSGSRGTQEYIDKDNNIDKDKDTNKTKHNPLGAEIIKSLESIDPKNKLYYNNTSQRKACDFLIEEYSLETVKQAINFYLMGRGKLKYLPSISTPCELRDKWNKLQGLLERKAVETQEIRDSVLFT